MISIIFTKERWQEIQSAINHIIIYNAITQLIQHINMWYIYIKTVLWRLFHRSNCSSSTTPIIAWLVTLINNSLSTPPGGSRHGRGRSVDSFHLCWVLTKPNSQIDSDKNLVRQIGKMSCTFTSHSGRLWDSWFEPWLSQSKDLKLYPCHSLACCSALLG